MNLFTYLDSLIISSEINGVKPMLLSAMLRDEDYESVASQLSYSGNYTSRHDVHDSLGESGIFIEYCGFRFRIYKPQ